MEQQDKAQVKEAVLTALFVGVINAVINIAGDEYYAFQKRRRKRIRDAKKKAKAQA